MCSSKWFFFSETVTFFIIWRKSKFIVAFTCTSLPLKLYTSVFGCGCSFGFEQKKFGWSTDLDKKRRHGAADSHTPIDLSPKTQSCLVTAFSKVKMLLQLVDKFASKHWAYRPPTLHSKQILPLLAACSKIYRFLRLLSVRFSTSCGFLRRDFQLLPFRTFLRVNRKNTIFLLQRLAAACVSLRRDTFLPHFLHVH